jgi:hypothetical protein
LSRFHLATRPARPPWVLPSPTRRTFPDDSDGWVGWRLRLWRLRLWRLRLWRLRLRLLLFAALSATLLWVLSVILLRWLRLWRLRPLSFLLGLLNTHVRADLGKPRSAFASIWRPAFVFFKVWRHFRDGNCARKAELASHTTAGQSLVLPNGKISHRKVPKRIIQTDDIALPARRSNFRGRSAGRTTMPGQEVKRN